MICLHPKTSGHHFLVKTQTIFAKFAETS